MSRFSRSSSMGANEHEDADAATDELLNRDRKTWSKGRIRRMRIMSAITGRPSGRKLVSEMLTDSDVMTWNIRVHEKTINCAKIFNPVVWEKNKEKWREISKVQRLEVEDPEGTLTSIPKHVVQDMTELDAFSITWTKIKSLPVSLFHVSLRALYVQRNQLKTLNGIERAENLQILDASHNQLTVLPKTFGQLQSLTTLNVSGNSLKELPDSIGQLVRLKTFDCSNNKLKTLPESVCNNIDLNSLDICNNQITSLPNSIGCLPKLEDLRARSNQLSLLPVQFGQLVSLNSLLLRKNLFTNVPEQLGSLTNLQNLNMRDNSISSMNTTIASLRHLILDGNELTRIEPALLACASLQMLSLQNNKIREIPDQITKLKNLRTLHLSGNSDIAEVPEVIDQLRHLRHLGLRATKLTTVPRSICQMENLASIDLDDCTELETYIKLEYRKDGLAGVRRHFTPDKSADTDGEVEEEEAPATKPAKEIEVPHPDVSGKQLEMRVPSLVYHNDDYRMSIMPPTGLPPVNPPSYPAPIPVTAPPFPPPSPPAASSPPVSPPTGSVPIPDSPNATQATPTAAVPHPALPLPNAAPFNSTPPHANVSPPISPPTCPIVLPVPPNATQVTHIAPPAVPHPTVPLPNAALFYPPPPPTTTTNVSPSVSAPACPVALPASPHTTQVAHLAVPRPAVPLPITPPLHSPPVPPATSPPSNYPASSPPEFSVALPVSPPVAPSAAPRPTPVPAARLVLPPFPGVDNANKKSKIPPKTQPKSRPSPGPQQAAGAAEAEAGNTFQTRNRSNRESIFPEKIDNPASAQMQMMLGRELADILKSRQMLKRPSHAVDIGSKQDDLKETPT